MVLRGRAAGDVAKDAMELRVASETRIEGGFEQRALPPGIAFDLVAFEKSLHALAIAEINDREPRLLFEQAAEP